MTEGIANKRFINNHVDVVQESIDGLLLCNPHLARLDGFPNIKVVLRNDWNKENVALISGGGSGHEPAHAALVGEGFLTAAVCGEIFASPSTGAILATIRQVAGDQGVLLIVKNYTGDRINFGLAAEKAKAEGIKVEMIVVGDDVTLPDAPQPRGVAGTVFVHKIAGAAALEGKSLQQVYECAKEAATSVVSVGVALRSCSLPSEVVQRSRIGRKNYEFGLGIHGEPGAQQAKFESVDKIVDRMVEVLSASLVERHGKDNQKSLVALINSLGSVPPLELSIVARRLLQSSIGSRIELLIGPAIVMSSLDMIGVSISLMPIVDDVQRNRLLLATPQVRCWPPAVKLTGKINLIDLPYVSDQSTQDQLVADSTGVSFDVKSAVLRVCDTIDANKAEWNQLDSKSGDGDTGDTFAMIGTSLRGAVDSGQLSDGVAAHTILSTVSDLLEQAGGGSSGVLLALFFAAASRSSVLAKRSDQFALADFEEGLKAIQHYGGGAKVGDRTMMDALIPAIDAFRANEDAVEAAKKGAEATKNMTTTKFGRSSYVPSEHLTGNCDPGAVAVAQIIGALFGK